jgi:hypothetical protein
VFDIEDARGKLNGSRRLEELLLLNIAPLGTGRAPSACRASTARHGKELQKRMLL